MMFKLSFNDWVKISEKIVTTESGCWVYTGGLCNGYGQIQRKKLREYVHRLMYDYLVGDIPENKEIDHICRNRACCNPVHLEVVSAQVNTIRGNGPSGINARKTTCINGHLYEGNNLIIDSQGARQCRICRNARWRRNWVKRQQVIS